MLKAVRTRIAVFLIVTLLFVLLSPFINYAGMKMTPYLQAVTANSVYVLVETDSESPVTVSYGETTSYGMTAKTESVEGTIDTEGTKRRASYVHNIKLTGLKANTTYHYQVNDGGKTSDDYRFSTAVPAGTPFRFAFMADMRSQTDVHGRIAALVKESGPRFSVYGGDLCVDSNYSSFKNEFFIPNQLDLSSEVPFFNAVGNHEGWSTNTRAFTQAPESASKNQGYYSFDYGDVHFLVLNNEDDMDESSEQFKFAKKDLESSKSPWKIAVFHKPAYCKGGHNEDQLMIAYTDELFVPNGVNMVLAGHSHFYQHNLVDDIHHMVLGSAGAPLYEPGKGNYTEKSLKEYSYGIFDVSSTMLRLQVFNDTGKLLETIEVPKPASQPTPTVKPTPPVKKVTAPVIKVNGKAVKFSANPVIVKDTVTAPAETLAKALGAAYKYDSKAKAITIARKGKATIQLKVDSSTAVIGGKKYTMTAPVKLNKVPFVPVKFIAEKLGYKYGYDSRQGIVSIIGK